MLHVVLTIHRVTTDFVRVPFVGGSCHEYGVHCLCMLVYVTSEETMLIPLMSLKG